ncbi:MAG: hypothetical protein OET79_14340, partial [Nitrospirota bacterium]|nr:hypothetical protein [Nitrospirota bacterium]
MQQSANTDSAILGAQGRRLNHPLWAASLLLASAAVALAQPQASAPPADEEQVSFEKELITLPRQLT